MGLGVVRRGLRHGLAVHKRLLEHVEVEVALGPAVLRLVQCGVDVQCVVQQQEGIHPQLLLQRNQRILEVVFRRGHVVILLCHLQQKFFFLRRQLLRGLQVVLHKLFVIGCQGLRLLECGHRLGEELQLQQTLTFDDKGRSEVLPDASPLDGIAQGKLPLTLQHVRLPAVTKEHVVQLGAANSERFRPLLNGARDIVVLKQLVGAGDVVHFLVLNSHAHKQVHHCWEDVLEKIAL
mmetsp:Transcript_34491/g.86642  ORF Transcript_34491/g.86642 Transcript_34491/m.86642 type:complete len:235 (+) Transcript_34491:1411-2115(+)